jgi:signal transduction histidine kinase
MSIKKRLALLLGLLLLTFLTAWLVLSRLERNEFEEVLANARSSRVQMLNHWIDASNRALPQFAAEYSHAEELTSGDLPGGERIRQIREALTSSGIDALWLIGADGTPRFNVAVGEPGAIVLPLDPAEFKSLVDATPNPHFFAEENGSVLELGVRRLASGTEKSAGWLVVARRLDQNYLAALANLIEGTVSLVAPSENSLPSTVQDATVVLRPLPDWQGRQLRVLRAEYREADLHRMIQVDVRPIGAVIGCGLLTILTLGVALQTWVLRPLQWISDSLAHGDPSSLKALSEQKTELGRIAQLVEFSFAQQRALRESEAALRHTLDERARLGWNLHDGIIQSLYAAGMGLAGVRALLQPDQHLAAGRLEQTRGILNETIHDLRNFITGLEPQALKQQTFAQAVAGVLATMQAIRPMHTKLEIDDAFAAQLSLAQRVHALQIVREAVSNAMRHGEAKHVTVTLRAQNGGAEFEISDDGRGFDPTTSSKGNGLGNLAERASELGAKFQVQSAPGKGTRVKLTFELL